MSLVSLLADTFYRPPIAMGLIVLLLGVTMVAALFAARRERARLTPMLRLVAIAGLCWLLMGPSRSEMGQPGNAAPPRLAVLVDASASMAQDDAAPRATDPRMTRLQVATDAWLNDGRLAELRAVSNVEVFAFDQQLWFADSTPIDPAGSETRLFESLAQIDADATLILSDGHDTTAPVAPASEPTPFAQAGRLYAVPVGASRSAPDVALQAWADSDRLFEDQSTTITAALYTRGLSGEAAEVELVHNGEVVERRPIMLDDGPAEVRFDVTPPLDAGQTVSAHHYAARVRLTGSQESYTDNNREDVFIQVSRGKVRVLLVEGEPYWDTRSLSRLVGSHPRFELTALFGFGDWRSTRILGEGVVEDGADPLDPLERFDVVILGRHVDRLVPDGFADDLQAFVRGGGAVLMARARPVEPEQAGDRLKAEKLLDGFAPISPVQWAEPVLGEMQVRVSAAGVGSPLAGMGDDAVLSRLPGMLAATRIEGRRAASVVVLEQQQGDGPSMAALTTMRVGSGVVMAVLTEGLWRWELLPQASADAQTETLYGAFWVRALQWLASGGEFLPGQDIALELDRLSVQPGEPVGLRVSTRYIETDGLKLRMIAEQPDGASQPISLMPSGTPGSYVASYTPGQSGVVTFKLDTPGRDDLIEPGSPLTARLAAVDRSTERRDMSARPELLKALTEPTGGRCLGLDEPGPLLDYLQMLQDTRGAAERVDYDFNRWPAFLWVAGFLGLEWILRRRSGLR